MVEYSRNINVVTPKEPTRIKLLVVGEPGTGKTSIAKKWSTDVFEQKYEPTIGVDFFCKELKGVTLNLWDMSGHSEFFEVRNEFYKDCQGILLVYDISNRRSFDSLDMWLREANRYGAQNIPVAVCGNKADLETRRGVPRNEAENWAQSRRFLYFEVSAATGSNLNDMMKALCQKMK